MHCTLPILLAANQGCNEIIVRDLAVIIHTLLNEVLQLIQQTDGLMNESAETGALLWVSHNSFIIKGTHST